MKETQRMLTLADLFRDERVKRLGNAAHRVFVELVTRDDTPDSFRPADLARLTTCSGSTCADVVQELAKHKLLDVLDRRIDGRVHTVRVAAWVRGFWPTSRQTPGTGRKVKGE